jgi:alkaline phosphatase D
VLQQFEALRTQALGRAPSILGATQTQWWKDTMGASSATWKVWGNEVMLNHLQADLTQPQLQVPPPYNALYIVNADAWDGYPTHKAELLGYLRTQGIDNVIAITGDLHAFQCGIVRDQPVTGQPVLVDFVCAGISSSSFYSYRRPARRTRRWLRCWPRPRVSTRSRCSRTPTCTSPTTTPRATRPRSSRRPASS